MISTARKILVRLALAALVLCGCSRQAPAQTASATATLTVDFGTSLGLATHRASGILHSFSATEPPDAFVRPIKLRNFRGRANSTYLYQRGFYDRLTTMGVRHVQPVISDNWGYPSIFWGWPADNYTEWEKTVASVVNNAKSRKWTVEYDIWNEPDIGYFWSRSREEYYETWRRAYVKIRSLDTTATIVGPSISSCNMTFLTEFLQYAKANNCLPDILSWHELGGRSGSNIPTRLQQVKDYLTSESIPITRFSINEIVPQAYRFNPGPTITYFAGIERSDVESAMHSCWGDAPGSNLDNGENRSLDGMLTWDTKRPRSIWWAYEAYAEITGQLAGVTGGAKTSLRIDGVAGYDAEKRAAGVLLGSYETTQTWNLNVELTNLDKAPDLVQQGAIYVELQRIPNSDYNALESMEPIFGGSVPVEGNKVTVTLPGFAANDGYFLRVMPQAAVHGSWWQKLW